MHICQIYEESSSLDLVRCLIVTVNTMRFDVFFVPLETNHTRAWPMLSTLLFISELTALAFDNSDCLSGSIP